VAGPLPASDIREKLVDLAGQIAAAEVVFLPMEELRISSDGQVERQAIGDAIRLLSVLKNENTEIYNCNRGGIETLHLQET
jgi:hypothetical protein